MSVSVQRDGAVTTVILDRPRVRNAVDRHTAGELSQAFAAFDADDEAAVAVLFGAGPTFCAGADLRALSKGDVHRLEEDGDGPLGPTRMALSKPVIAAVAGHAVAGGLELALWCDLRVAQRDAVFGVFCRRWGVPLMDGGTVRLPRLIGMSRAMDMILTGRPVDAEEALAMGLVNRVVDDGTVRQEAEALAQQIARMPQACLRSDRRSAYEQHDQPMDDALRNEFRLGMQTINSGETAAGVQRFAGGSGRHGSFDDL